MAYCQKFRGPLHIQSTHLYLEELGSQLGQALPRCLTNLIPEERRPSYIIRQYRGRLLQVYR